MFIIFSTVYCEVGTSIIGQLGFRIDWLVIFNETEKRHSTLSINLVCTSSPRKHLLALMAFPVVC